ncbi:MAG: T9SS type A sorting domain-containing protein [Bacteroidales bacterium]|jgi:photosystem II stability/assembly factor-like uncharacterized protein|nr:T9SS type A sorting domain-containing protein [Bacteroidales bacterium]
MKRTFVLIVLLHISSFLYSQQSWQPLYINDTIHPISILPISHDTIIFGIYPSGEYPNGGVYRSIDGGVSWQFHVIEYGTWGVYSLLLVENEAIYAGTNWGVFKSVNWGENWEHILTTNKNCISLENLSPSTLFVGSWGFLSRSTDNGITWDTCLVLHQNTVINSILAVSDSLIYLAATSYTSTDGGLYVSYDGGGSWNRIGLVMYNIQSLAISPNDELYAGCYYSGLYKSEDYGFTWENVLPDMDAVSVVTRGNEVFVGCEDQSFLTSGIFYSGDGGETWEDRTHNMTNKSIEQIAFSHDDYLYSLSKWEYLSLGPPLNRSMNPVVGVQSKNIKACEIYTYPNPCNNYLNITIPESICYKGSSIKVYLYNLAGDVISIESIQNYQENIFVRLNVSQYMPGLYIIKLSCEKQTLSKKILIQ